MKFNRILAIALLVSAGCGNEEFSGPDRAGVDLKIEARIGADQTSEKDVWIAGDRIGVSVVGMEGYALNTNLPYGYDELAGSFVAGDKQIYLKGARQQLSAYYPYVESNNTHPVGVRVDAGVEYQQQAMWSRLDFLYATATATREEPTATFTFNHTMGQLLLHFDVEGGFDGELSYTLSGLRVRGEFDTANGVVAPIDDAEGTAMSLTTSTEEALLIVIPQQADLTLELLYHNKVYGGKIEHATFTASTCSRYTVRVDASSEQTPSLVITHEGDGSWLPAGGGQVESTPDEETPGENPDNPEQPEDPSIEIPDSGVDPWTPGSGGSVESEEEEDGSEEPENPVEPDQPEEPEPEDPSIEIPDNGVDSWTPGPGGSVGSEEEEGGSEEPENPVEPDQPEEPEPEDPSIEIPDNGVDPWTPGNGGSVESENENQ